MYSVNNLVEIMFDRHHNATPAISTDAEGNVNKNDLMIVVSNIILQLGIPANIRGFVYLREAIIMKVNNPLEEMPITKYIYPTVAKKFNSSAINVERAIRHAIEVAWKRMDQSYREKIFYNPFSHTIKRPTNTEFIATIADRITLEVAETNEGNKVSEAHTPPGDTVALRPNNIGLLSTTWCKPGCKYCCRP